MWKMQHMLFKQHWTLNKWANCHFTSQHRGSRRNVPAIAAVVAAAASSVADDCGGAAVVPINNTADDNVSLLATDVHRVSFADALQQSTGN